MNENSLSGVVNIIVSQLLIGRGELLMLLEHGTYCPIRVVGCERKDRENELNFIESVRFPRREMRNRREKRINKHFTFAYNRGELRLGVIRVLIRNASELRCCRVLVLSYYMVIIMVVCEANWLIKSEIHVTLRYHKLT